MSLRSITLMVRRLSSGVLDQATGLWSEEVEGTPFPILCSLQPLSSSQMQSLPEGRRDKESYTLFTDTPLNTVTSQNPDRMMINGDDFEVFSVNPWQNGILSHYEVLVQKRDLSA